jgi:hypothetical protein
VLVVDELSRLSRDQIESERLCRRLDFRGIAIVGCSDGYDSKHKSATILRAIQGLKNSLDLDALRDRTHRGLSGQALREFSAGGLTYGYKSVPEYQGTRIVGFRREIFPEQAAIVREIFRRYAAGETQMAIASSLNAQGVPSPGASWERTKRRKDGRWLVSTVHTLLRNELYAGRVVWNKSSWIKNPETGKRVRRERPQSEWIEREDPALAIVDRETFDKSRARMSSKAIGHHNARQRYLLSGLLVCAECGSKLVICGSKPLRYLCSSRHHGGEHACSNNVGVRLALAEEVILEDVRQQTLSPLAIEHGVASLRKMLSEPEEPPPDLSRYDAEIAAIEGLVKTGQLSLEIAQPAIERAQKLRNAAQRARRVSPDTSALFRAETLYIETANAFRQRLEKPADVDIARGALLEMLEQVRCVPAPDRSHLIGVIASTGASVLLKASGMNSLVAGACYERVHVRRLPFLPYRR